MLSISGVSDFIVEMVYDILANESYLCLAMNIKQVEQISKALGDPYRLRIMEMINQQTDCIACADLASQISLSQSTISHHVKQLIDSGLIAAEKDGRNMLYRLNKPIVAEYLKFLGAFSQDDSI